mmetsp:Transcript_32426/g.62303  ORF Transcript_32426/g.62303 Transcript_32426/m.62303 type:complete len:645 (+) Transcript_32426:491-2425(+)|eukprot:CAMPEP_0114238826 /NCGR_PEP_ID=MMETSP0058-20121206/8128_1 /TAXON_ID=36894 /ORGANISM="Pyramimonas parkeae, CCMP726" /LENGTH=644 /DNA_ID=CAMNT_0001350955 /DNA_START=491 /DNA_END=2425 /DNA_ORIENTATION=-
MSDDDEIEFTPSEIEQELAEQLQAAEGERVISKARSDADKNNCYLDDSVQEDVASRQTPTLLSAQLNSLDRHFSDNLERWNKAEDFSKVDLVCAELIKKGGYGEALKYMERVKKLVDQLTSTLREKEVQGQRSKEAALVAENSVASAAGSVGHPGPSKEQLKALSRNRSERVSQLMRRDLMPATQGDAGLKKDLLAAQKKFRELQKRYDEDMHANEQHVQSLTKQLDAWQSEAETIKRTASSTKDRLIKRSLNHQASETRATQAEARVQDLTEKLEGLSVLLTQAEARAAADASKVQKLHQRLLDSGNRDRESGSKEAKLASAVAGLEAEVQEKDTQLRATSKAANAALAKQDQVIQGLVERLDQQALELQRRDEILHAIGAKLQEGGLTIVEFLSTSTSGPPPTPPTPVADDSSLPSVHFAPSTAASAHRPSEVSSGSKPGTASTTRGSMSAGYNVQDWGAHTKQGTKNAAPRLPAARAPATPGGTVVHPHRPGTTPGGKARAQVGLGYRPASVSGPKREATPPLALDGGGGVPIRVTENEGAGAHFKPWVVHQPVRCEPAGHFVVIGVPQFQSVERAQAETASMHKVCSCGKLSSRYFELSGHVVWRGRTAVIGPPIDNPGPKHRSVLGLEGHSEENLTAFS